MNILFVNYGGLQSNSMEHILGFAVTLEQMGHTCIVAIPELEQDRRVHIRLVSYNDLKTASWLFDGDIGPDIVHAWTPRECVRRAVWPVMQQCPKARLIIHLEDNEQWITARSAGVPYQQLRQCTKRELAYLVPMHCMHPIYGPEFLNMADGVTAIIHDLSAFVLENIPVKTVLPGVDLNVFRPQVADPGLYRMFDIPDHTRLIYYPGGVNAMNRDDLMLLFKALPIINKKGIACHLIQTGPHADEFIKQVDPELAQFIHVLGYIDRDMIPKLMALADVLVQPGQLDNFNRYRLPSKIPQFLAAGRPVVIPDMNIARLLKDDENVLLLKEGTSEEIAKRCIEVFMNPDKAKRLGQEAHAFAQTHFDLKQNTQTLISFYDAVEKQITDFTRTCEQPACVKGLLKVLDPSWIRSRMMRFKSKGMVPPNAEPML